MKGQRDLNFTETSRPLILVHRGMDRIYESGSINIMLSPQFYTMKREELPIKYQYQVKKLASSVLESLLVDGVEYQYYVYKDGADWVFIAYDPSEIAEFLMDRGIKIENISKLFFAQNYLDKFNTPLELSPRELLATIDSTAVILPSSLIGEKMTNRVFNQKVSNRDGITFGFNNNSILNYKESIIISSILAIFAVMFIVEGISYRGQISSMEDEVALLLSKHSSLQSKYSRDNIAKKYRKIDKIERAKRDLLKDLSNLFSKGVELEQLSLTSRGFSTTLKAPNENTLLKIKSGAKRKGFKTSRVDDTLIKIEGKL